MPSLWRTLTRQITSSSLTTRTFPAHRPSTSLVSISPSLTRSFHTCHPHSHGGHEWKNPKSEDEVVNIVYVDRQDNEIPIRGKVGDNVMYLAHRHKIEIEGEQRWKRIIDLWGVSAKFPCFRLSRWYFFSSCACVISLVPTFPCPHPHPTLTPYPLYPQAPARLH